MRFCRDIYRRVQKTSHRRIIKKGHYPALSSVGNMPCGHMYTKSVFFVRNKVAVHAMRLCAKNLRMQKNYSGITEFLPGFTHKTVSGIVYTKYFLNL